MSLGALAKFRCDSRVASELKRFILVTEGGNRYVTGRAADRYGGHAPCKKDGEPLDCGRDRGPLL